jgi:raffinose/stachyose/melibiose transport system permease protein
VLAQPVVRAERGRAHGRRSARSLPVARRWATGYSFLFPAFSVAVVFAYYPACSALIHAFYSWNNYTPAKFIGLQNFRLMANDPVLASSAVHVGEYALFWFAMVLTVPLLMARLVVGLRSRRAQAVLRFIFMLTLVAPIVVIAQLWSFFYDPSVGLINEVLGAVGLKGLEKPWLGDPNTALYALMFMWVPFVDAFSFLVYTAGLQGIDAEIMDAAAMDGASRTRTFLSVELPLLFGQVRLVLVVTVAAVLTNFTTFLIMTNGGPGNATMVPGLLMFQDAFYQGNYGYGTAIAVSLFVVTLGLTLIIMRLFRPRYQVR